ncbi:hypothetical protein J502_3055 [Acinetobacter sp. 1294596]|nr:hypothetical protein J546_2262 [Acinetobacter sp. 1461402]EXF55855.1 hypothetical protein J502_3055 [Acinetobacter sp. 1294596]
MNKTTAIFFFLLIIVMIISVLSFFNFKKMNCDGDTKFFIYHGTQYKCSNYQK